MAIKSKYLYVLIIFVFFLFLGRNLDWDAKPVQGIFNMAPTENFINAPGTFQGEAGKSYRVSFKAIALPDQFQSPDSIAKFEIRPQSPFDDINSSLQFELTTNGWQYSKQIEFTAVTNFNNLVFARTLPNDASQIRFSNISLTQINCSGCALSQKVAGSAIDPIIYGNNASAPETIYGNNASAPETIFKFNRRGQVFGQVFKAETDNIFQVKLSLQIIGSGGLGHYRLQLQGIDQTGGNYSVSSKILAETYFNTFELRSMNMQTNDYLIPLAAKIEKNKYYYLAISNDQAKFNLLNTLAVTGSSSASSDSYAFKLGDLKNTGSINFAIYGYENKKDNGRKMLFNETEESFSGGRKLYFYGFSGSPADYLDIFESNFNTGKVFYDKVSGGISSTNEPGNFYTYKFELPEVPKKVSFSVKSNPGFLKIIPYWSVDDKNWQRIGNPVFSRPDSYSTIISDLGSKTLFLKLVTDEPADVTSSITLGNLSDLQVYAEY